MTLATVEWLSAVPVVGPAARTFCDLQEVCVVDAPAFDHSRLVFPLSSGLWNLMQKLTSNKWEQARLNYCMR